MFERFRAKLKKTLLIASSAPGLSGVGGVLIGDMLSVADISKVSLVAIIPKAHHEHADRSRIADFHPLETRFEWFPESFSALSGSLSRLRHRVLRYDRHVANLAGDTIPVLDEQSPQQVWAILNSTTAIDLCYKLLPNLKADLIVQVWDDPYHLCQQRHVDRFTRKRTLSRFASLLRRADRVGVICEEAANQYSKITNAPMTIVRHGLAETRATARYDFETTDEFRIGFSGSLYATDAWRTLEKALDQVDWRLNGRKVVLIVAGGRIEFTSRSRADARFVGWRSQNELHDLLGTCDVLYLPQSFSSVDRALTGLSFPTKLSSYVATGRPVIAHGPAYGSVHRFCRDHQFGVVCDSLVPATLRDLLQRLAVDDDFRRQQAIDSARIAREQLTYARFAQGVRELLGIVPQVPEAA